MFKYILQESWKELKPALILYSAIITGAWAFATHFKIFN